MILTIRDSTHELAIFRALESAEALARKGLDGSIALAKASEWHQVAVAEVAIAAAQKWLSLSAVRIARPVRTAGETEVGTEEAEA